MPPKIIPILRKWFSVIFSPSTKPQKIATIGMRYVTDEANIAVVFFTKTLKATRAMEVPIVDNKTI